jgi:hypothetical protein
MLEKEIEDYFKWVVERSGGKTWKFTSPSNRGVSDRIACMPGGRVFMVELKRPKGGRLSPLQQIFAKEMLRLGVPYFCLWSKDDVDSFIASVGTPHV